MPSNPKTSSKKKISWDEGSKSILPWNRYKIKRRDRQTVQRWIATIHPDANDKYKWTNGERKKDAFFPTDRATIRRYFAWCHRHKLNPANTAHCCLYWGVSEPSTVGNSRFGAIFYPICAAQLEKLLGASLVMSSDDNHDDISKIHEIRDNWNAVVEWSLKDLNKMEDYSHLPPITNKSGLEAPYVPGRILKYRIDISCNSSVFNSSYDNRNSIHIRPIFTIKQQTSYFSKCNARTVLEPKERDVVLDDILYEAGTMILRPLLYSNPESNTQLLPTRWDLCIKMQPYVHRNARAIDATQYPEAHRRMKRSKRHHRRAMAREYGK